MPDQQAINPSNNKHLLDLKRSIELIPEATILCETKDRNPNYFSIIFANQKFYQTFGISEFNLIGKNYDFLFSDLDLDHSSEDQIGQVTLIKAVKNFQPCSTIVGIPSHNIESTNVRYKVAFNPSNFKYAEGIRYATFMFEKVETTKPKKAVAEEIRISSNLALDLERALHNERLLREVGSLIISDLEINDIAHKVAKILGEHLKADRCLIHDYDNARTNFIAEYRNDYTTGMLDDERREENLNMLSEYINFQNHFYQHHHKKNDSGLFVVEDLASDSNFAAIRHICEKYSIASQISITTTFNGKINGGIYLHQSDKKTWLADEIELVEMIADQISIAIDRSESIERVMVTNHALMEKTAQLKEALQHEQEMRKIQSEFVALVSHEFKTPLQIIDSTRELLSRKIKSHNIVDEAVDKALDRIKSGIQRMNGLIHSTLNLAKMESGEGAIKLQPEIFDLQKFTFEIIEKNSNLAQSKNIRIITNINELPTEFDGDPKLLDHAITNVISNAIKYSKNNSTIKILAKANDQKVALRVIDQGIGIPREDLENIGKKFFRAQNTLSVAGTGIGLYLTKHFVELHEGDVAIDSEAGVGTTVTITLTRF